MNKRGISHVEFIISFVLFVGFLVAGLYFFSPLDGTRVVESSLYYTFTEVEENLTTELESFSVVINQGVQDTIIYIDLSPEDIRNLGSLVKDSDGIRLASFSDGVGINIDRISSSNNFIRIMLNPDFDNSALLNGRDIGRENYTISSREFREVISEKRFLALVNLYNNDYEAVKEEFNIPARIDFGFYLEFEDETISAEKDIPLGLEVFSESKRVQVVRESGDIAFADLRIRIW